MSKTSLGLRRHRIVTQSLRHHYNLQDYILNIRYTGDLVEYTRIFLRKVVYSVHDVTSETVLDRVYESGIPTITPIRLVALRMTHIIQHNMKTNLNTKKSIDLGLQKCNFLEQFPVRLTAKYTKMRMNGLN